MPLKIKIESWKHAFEAVEAVSALSGPEEGLAVPAYYLVLPSSVDKGLDVPTAFACPLLFG